MEPYKYSIDTTNEDEVRELFRSFPKFLEYVWWEIGLPPPDWAQLEIASFLQDGDINRKVLLCFRSLGKTYITGAYAAWRLWRDPDLKVVIVSANGDFAGQISSFVKKLIHGCELLQCLIPNKHQRNSDLIFDVNGCKVSKDPSVKSLGITGQLAGSRAGLLISDDVETPSNTETEKLRTQLEDRVKEYPDLLGDAKNGEIVYLGTPQIEMSLYLKLPEKGYTVKIMPARYPNEELTKFYGDMLFSKILDAVTENPELGTACGEYGGAPTVPVRFNNEMLISKEIEQGKARFQMQYMLNTHLGDVIKYVLKIKNLMFLDLPLGKPVPTDLTWSSDPRYEITVTENTGLVGDKYYSPGRIVDTSYRKLNDKLLTIDPSGSGTDETAWCVTGECSGLIYLLDQGGFIDGFGVPTLTELAEIAKKYQVNKIRIEANMGDGMFKPLLQPYLQATEYPCFIEEFKVSSQKEKRIINTLRPVLDQHRLVVNKSIINSDYESVFKYRGESIGSADRPFYRLFYQLARMTEERGCIPKDDRVDNLAAAVDYYTSRMNQNPKKIHERSLLTQFVKGVKLVEKAYRMSQDQDDYATTETNQKPNGFDWLMKLKDKPK